jgi:hypothetical protein
MKTRPDFWNCRLPAKATETELFRVPRPSTQNLPVRRSRHHEQLHSGCLWWRFFQSAETRGDFVQSMFNRNPFAPVLTVTWCSVVSAHQVVPEVV